MSPCGDAVRPETLHPASIGSVDHALEAWWESPLPRCHQVGKVFIISKLSGSMQLAEWQPYF